MGVQSKAASVVISKPSTGTQMTISAIVNGAAGNNIFVVVRSTNDTGVVVAQDGTPQDFGALTPFDPVLEIYFGYINPSPTFQQVINAINAGSTLCTATLDVGTGTNLFDLNTLSSASMTFSFPGSLPPEWTFPPPIGPPVLIANPPADYCGRLTGGQDGFSDDTYKAKVMRHMLAPPWDKRFGTPMTDIITVIGASDNDLGGLFGRDDFLPDEDV